MILTFYVMPPKGEYIGAHASHYPKVEYCEMPCSDTNPCEGCEQCCEHDYDPSEGMMCINCGAEYPY